MLVYGYIAAVVIAWCLIRFQGDHWWPATLLLYGPRWIYGAPLGLLIPAAVILRPRLLLPVGIGGCIALFSLMGFNVPWRSWGGADSANLRVLTYNIQRYAVPGESFSALLDQQQPDVIAVQECAGVGRWTDWWVRHDEWHTVHRGELMIASRFPIKEVEVAFSHWPTARKPVLNAIYCVVETPRGDVGFCNLHLDTPRRALSAVLDRETVLNLDNSEFADGKLEYRRKESQELLEWLQQFPGPMVVAGDFNMPADSRIYRSDWEQFRSAFNWTAWGLGYTKQTIIRRRQYGLRIDHILTDDASTPIRCWVGPDLGSDHLPLFADLALPQERRSAD